MLAQPLGFIVLYSSVRTCNRPALGDLGWGREGQPSRRRGSRGQAMVEFAILIPFLFSIVLGSVDFGRVFGQNAAILGAAREAVRQTIFYSTSSGSNPLFNTTPGLEDNNILTVAQNELGTSNGGSSLSLAPVLHRYDCSITPASPPPTSWFPSTADTGYLFICWAGTGNDGKQHVRITIAWTMSIITPFVQNMVGTPHLHAIVEGTEQSP